MEFSTEPKQKWKRKIFDEQVLQVYQTDNTHWRRYAVKEKRRWRIYANKSMSDIL